MPRDNGCMCMAHICFMSVVVVYGNVCCVAVFVENSYFKLGVFKYVVCLCRGCDGCCVFCLDCEAWNCRCKYTPLSETKHQHNANSKMVFHKAACYHPHCSTYTHLTLQHHRHQ